MSHLDHPTTPHAPAHNAKEPDEHTFRHSLPVQIRFNDVDRYGHVNNNSYFAYYDLGKEEYLRSVLRTDYRNAEVVPVIAHIEADFISPIFYGDEIAVQTRTAHIGQKSFTLEQRAINQKTGQVVCQCRTVMVCFNLRTQESAEMPEAYRQAISRCEQTGE